MLQLIYKECLKKKAKASVFCLFACFFSLIYPSETFQKVFCFFFSFVCCFVVVCLF